MTADTLGSSPYGRVYATIAEAKAGLALEVKAHGPARKIRCGTAGTLPVRFASGDTFEPLAFAAGETLPIQAAAIDDGAPATGCVPITILW